MKYIVSPAFVLAAVLCGCGSGDKHQQSPQRANNSAPASATSFHTAGAPPHPESYKAAQAKAKRMIRADPNYTYVHAHLEINYPIHTQVCNWALSAAGQCPGSFLGGSTPFNNVKGNTQWQEFGAGKGPTDIPAVRDGGLKITQATSTNRRIECYIRDRSKGDCYTLASQQGKPTGQEGGPLALDASFSSDRRGYVFLHGFCRLTDRLCRPH